MSVMVAVMGVEETILISAMIQVPTICLTRHAQSLGFESHVSRVTERLEVRHVFTGTRGRN